MAGGKTYKVALVGQPNVGKSSLFTRLTGVGVISSNYPGTTVEFDEGVVTRNGKTVSVHDLPGTYSLSGNSDDEKVVLRDLWEGRNDTVVLVADATNLVSSLVLCFETLELGLPTIIALTKMDEARKRNRIDIDALSGILGVPVMPVSSKTSEGVDALADAVCEGKARAPVFRVEYMPDVEKAIVALEDGLPDNLKFNKRGVAVKLLEESEPFDEMIGTELRHTVAVMKKLYRDNTGQGLGVSIATSRYAKAESIVSEVVSESDTKPSLADRISDVMITPITGIPILLAVCLAILTTIVYVGSFLDDFASVVNKVESITGQTVTMVRLPGGSINGYNQEIHMALLAELLRRGYMYYDWNVSGEDATSKVLSASDIAASVEQQVLKHSYSIVLLHDHGSSKNMVEAMRQLIPRLKEQGYTFAALDATVEPTIFAYPAI